MEKEYSYYHENFDGLPENACKKMRLAASLCVETAWPMAIINSEPPYVIGNQAFSSTFVSHESFEFSVSCIISNSPLCLIFEHLTNSLVTSRPVNIDDDIMFSSIQNGFVKERYFKFACDFIRNENSKVAGGIITVVETTEQVLAKHKWALLERLSDFDGRAISFGVLADSASSEIGPPEENSGMVIQGPGFSEPAASGARLENNAFPNPDASPSSRVKVLIVDDQPEVVELMRRLLKESCDVASANNGLCGLKKAREERPDLVIADMAMPGLSGLELLRAIRSDEAIHTMSVIMVSANASEEARLGSLAEGADDYLVKPFKMKEFTARVHSHVKMIRMRRAAAQREVELLRKIEEVEQNLESVLENTNETFLTLSPELRVLSVNAVGARIIGVEKAALIGRRLRECAFYFQGSVFESALLEAISTKSTIMTEYLHPVLGRWFDLRCYPAEHGLTVFSADITEKKLAEEALISSHAALELRVSERTQQLRNANKLLFAIFDRAPGGIALFSLDGRYIRANATYLKLLGYTEQELRSTYSFDSFLIPEQYRKKMALLQKLKSGETDTVEMEASYVVKNKTTIWVLNYFSTIRDENGEPSYFLKIMQDIGERKHAEQQIISSREELRALYETLQAVRDEERKALAREVHDQLGQILTAAKIDIKLLEDDIENREILPSYPQILSELKSARLTLDNGILAVRKISTELRPPEVADLGLCSAVRWHAKDFQQRTRIKCRLYVDEADIKERDSIAAIAIFRVFQEAMTNVLRHSSATEVSIMLTMRGENLVLRVLDNGVGISRVRMNTAESIGIKGMRERVELLGGKIFVGPVRSGGTLLTARVPCGAQTMTLMPSSMQGACGKSGSGSHNN